MQVSFDDGTLLLEDAPDTVPYAEWDDRVDEYRARAQQYRDIREWANGTDGQVTLSESAATVESFTDDARSYSEFHFRPSVAIEPRDYQQEALAAWRDNGRRGSVVLPTGSGKTFLAVQAIADAGVSTLVVVPTIDLMNQWHATLTNAFGDQLPDGVGVLGGGSHDVSNLTVTTYDSAYRYINEYGDQFGLLVVDEVHHLPAPTYQQIPEMTIAPYRLGLTATYERADGEHDVLEDLLGEVVYREEVDKLAGEYLSEYETLHLQVELTADERERYDEEYQIYREYVDSHDFDLWKENGYQEFLKRTSYDPEGRRALIAKQRAEKIARTAEKKLDTLDNLLKRHYEDRTIIFTANNDFAYEISQEFVVPCITHQTETDERTEILERFRTGQYSMLATSQVLDEGIDVPAANVGIILSGSSSKRQYAQRLGRILRPTDENQPARLYEIISEDTMETYVSQHRRQGVN
ncbi:MULTISPECIES: DEAD/DEAH box helicase family protein [Haloferacaceae]|jgi:superfamily II DNA or RNA helicase|uniref:DNA 3'-5' helicase n=1 Tax=Halohasta litchfieldiae TaxID=1073996 RepID=A0A1H6W3R3_9EURY|nr:MULTISPECIES: DEAD/DEAH box helicase family protein [Halorubraceae]ATW88257.1 DNA repair helicase RAD25 [Halohasta litchfieldiae]MCG1007897.1 DEAD/DEAH box helicase family protein [Halorubrum lacusprofundi]SEJ06925.1 DNA repair helicase RAD25 [Halohasta litchfieldiae]